MDLRFKLNKYFVDMIFEKLNKISSSNSGKLHFYSKIFNTNEYKLQDYIKFSLKKLERSQLTRLRIIAHSLFIETGRYCKPIIPKEKRLCYACKLLVENENILYFTVLCMTIFDFIIVIFSMINCSVVLIP